MNYFGIIGSLYIRSGRFYGIISLSIYRIVRKHASQDILNIDYLIRSVPAKWFILPRGAVKWTAGTLVSRTIDEGQIYMLLVKRS